MRRAAQFRLGIAFALLIAISLAACAGGVSEDRLNDLERESALNAEAARRAQVIAALEPLNPLRYHELDAVIRNDGRIPAAALIWASRAEKVLNWVDWPHELHPHVEQYGEWLASLLAAMHNDDAEAAAEPSRITHALAHTFEASVIAWLEGRSVPGPPGLAGLEPPEHVEHNDQHDAMPDQQMESMQSEHGAHDSTEDDGSE